MKKSKKFLAVLSTSAMLATVGAPAVLPGVAASTAFAAGAGTISAISVPTYSNTNTSASLGTILINVPYGALTGTNDSVTLTLPHGFTFSNVDPVIESGSANQSYDVSVYQLKGGQTVAGATYASVENINNNQIKIALKQAPGNGGTTDDLVLGVSLNNIKINGPSNGPVNVTVDAPQLSAFPTGSVTVANIQTSGMVDVASSDTTTNNNNFDFYLNLKEEVNNSLRSDQQAIKIKLPSGYEWTGTDGKSSNYSSAVLYGSIQKVDQNGKAIGSVITEPNEILKHIVTEKNGDDTLYVHLENDSDGHYVSVSPLSLKLGLAFDVKDDTLVKNGPVTAYLSGTTSVNTSSIQVGTYGDYSSTISVSSTPTIFAGHFNQQIGDITIKESIPGTFVSGRTIELTLPDNARWEDVFEADAKNNGNDTNGTPTANITTTNGLGIQSVTFTGTDHRTLKITIGSQSSGTDPGEIDLKNVFIATAANASGDLNVTAGGTAGVTGTVKVATVQAPATISVSSPANVSIGKANQPIGDITITEAAPGAFTRDTVADADPVSGVSDYQLVVKLDAAGAEWDKAPTVTVTNGDAQITNVYTSGDSLYMTLQGASSATPATITLSGGTIKLDNTTPVGPINVKLQGTAAAYAAYHVNTWYNDTTTVAKATVANVVSGINGQTYGNATFTIGSTSYTLNGQTATADVAPYIKNGRTYLPVTYVAQALGVPLQNIVWNNAERSVTIFNGSRVVKMVIGNKVLNVNGVQYTMDTAPEISSNRTMLPVAYLATALGVPYTWDATTQTVTFGQ